MNPTRRAPCAGAATRSISGNARPVGSNNRTWATELNCGASARVSMEWYGRPQGGFQDMSEKVERRFPLTAIAWPQSCCSGCGRIGSGVEPYRFCRCFEPHVTVFRQPSITR
jgi:hypothetical protein